MAYAVNNEPSLIGFNKMSCGIVDVFQFFPDDFINEVLLPRINDNIHENAV
jgi:hypothetical protein